MISGVGRTKRLLTGRAFIPRTGAICAALAATALASLSVAPATSASRRAGPITISLLAYVNSQPPTRSYAASVSVPAPTSQRPALTGRLFRACRAAVLVFLDHEPQSRAAAQAIANELEVNAVESERCDAGIAPGDLVFRFDAWDASKISARTLSHRDPDEWMEVVAFYDHLRDVSLRAGRPPRAAAIRDLAARLRTSSPR
jgi:hypothetical protein